MPGVEQAQIACRAVSNRRSSTVDTAEVAARTTAGGQSAPAVVDAVLFDFGGVITESPFESFNRYEDRMGVPRDTIRQINATNPDTNAWARLERSEVSVDEFAGLFEAEAADRGYEVSGSQVLACLSGGLRPQMVRALEILAECLPVGCITNNVQTGHGAGMARDAAAAAAVADVMKLFGVVIESSVVGTSQARSAHLRTGVLRVGHRPGPHGLSGRPGHQLQAGRRYGHEGDQGDRS